MLSQNNYISHRLWKMWLNIKTVAIAARAIFFAYSFTWFTTNFCLKGLARTRDLIFSELKTLRFPGNEDGIVRILEIATGSGVNLSYFPPKCKYITVDTNSYFNSILLQNLKKYPGIELENYINCGGEDISAVASNSIHAVVTSGGMCSVSDIQQVLKEIHRVLVPGGVYYFFEHILDEPGTFRYKLQKLLNVTGLWQAISHGCQFVNFEKELQQTQIFQSYTGQRLYARELSNFNIISYLVKSHFGGKAIKSK